MSTTHPALSIPADLTAWLDAHAESLDTEARLADEVLPRLAQADLLALGVPATQPGGRGRLADAIEAIAQVAEHSLSAAFVFWGHRAFTECVLHSSNAALQRACLPRLLRGQIAGASGLSNAMKYLSALEPLQVRAQPLGGAPGQRRWALSGRLPWVTNLRREGFIAAAAFDLADGGAPAIFAVPHDLPGVTRGEDLDLIALRGTHTAPLHVDQAEIDERWLIADDAGAFLARVRPSFVGLQCGMPMGLARRALATVQRARPAAQAALADDAARLAQTLQQLTTTLLADLAAQRYAQDAPALFRMRIALADVVAAAIALDIEASGGEGYLRGQGEGVARRVREASFVPIVTPSIVQLRRQLALHADAAR